MATNRLTIASDLTKNEINILTMKGSIGEKELDFYGERVAEHDKNKGIVFCGKYKASHLASYSRPK